MAASSLAGMTIVIAGHAAALALPAGNCWSVRQDCPCPARM
jgi:hypothetical protein